MPLFKTRKRGEAVLPIWQDNLALLYAWLSQNENQWHSALKFFNIRLFLRLGKYDVSIFACKTC